VLQCRGQRISVAGGDGRGHADQRSLLVCHTAVPGSFSGPGTALRSEWVNVADLAGASTARSGLGAPIRPGHRAGVGPEHATIDCIPAEMTIRAAD
jgi:hypothetical protein